MVRDSDSGPKTARNLGYGMLAVWLIALLVTIVVVALFIGAVI